MTGRVQVRVNPEAFTRRLLTDLFVEVSADQARKRAEAFLAAAPKVTDWNGRATDAELRERWERCHAVAAALRGRAYLLDSYGLPDDIAADVETVLDEMVA